ncbi:MAG: glycosyltransferase [Planctomycetes bacterium]|nr:glycosyltransferase [Planctomycetota bacterium]
MIRVMIVATDLELGGLPLRLARLAPYLRRAGVEPIIGCLSRPGPVSAMLEKAGFSTFSCDAAGRFDASCLARLATRVRRFNPDVLQGGLFHANLAVRMVGRCDRVRPIVTSTVTIEIERRWHCWGESLTAGLSDAHVANSNAVASHLVEELGFPRERVSVIPNGVDADAIAAAPPIDRATWMLPADAALLVWVGRMDPVKDLTTLVNAVNIVRDRHPVALALIGSGPERSAVERRIAECQLCGIVRCVGWREDVASWLRAADALVLTSRTEGSPNVVLEAIAAQCPVVVSDLPCCRELVTSPFVGRLCRVGDTADFAWGIEAVLSGGLRALAAANRQAILSRHRLDAIGWQWRQLYDLVLSHK